MREEQCVTVRRLDGPEIMEFDQEPVGFEQRRAADLAAAVKSDRRAHEVDFAARRQVVVPGEFAVLHLQVADQRHQKAAGHGVDKRRATLDGVAYPVIDFVEGLRRHCLEPIRQTKRCRHRRCQQSVQLHRAAERQRQWTVLLGSQVSLDKAANLTRRLDEIDCDAVAKDPAIRRCRGAGRPRSAALCRRRIVRDRPAGSP